MAGRGRGIQYSGGCPIPDKEGIQSPTRLGGGRGRALTANNQNTSTKKFAHVLVDEDLTRLNTKLGWMEFPLNQAEKVIVTESTTPSSAFFIRTEAAQTRFEQIEKEVNQVARNTVLLGNVLCEPRTTLVLSPLKGHEGYFRAEVMEYDRQTGILTLFYSDIGKVSQVSRGMVIKMPGSFRRIPRLVSQCRWDRAVAEEVIHPAPFKTLLAVASSVTLTATHKIVPGQFLVSLEGLKSQATFIIHSHPSAIHWLQELKHGVPEPEVVKKISVPAPETRPTSAPQQPQTVPQAPPPPPPPAPTRSSPAPVVSAGNTPAPVVPAGSPSAPVVPAGNTPAPVVPAQGAPSGQHKSRRRLRKGPKGQGETGQGPFTVLLPASFKLKRSDKGSRSPSSSYGEETRRRVQAWVEEVSLEVFPVIPFHELGIQEEAEMETPTPAV